MAGSGHPGAQPDARQEGRPDARPDAVVVGGGVAGLVAARELAVAGLRVVVLEAGPEPGGAVGRHTVAGLDLDSGAESFATRGGTVAALAAELGLAAAVTAPAPLGAWVQLPSGPATLPRAGLLGVPVDPWAPDVRRTLGVVGALRASADRLLPARVGAGGSFGALVQTRMGRRVLDRLVGPVVGGVHAADPADLDVRTVAPGLPAALAEHGSLSAAVASLRALAPAGAAVNGLVGGMHTLVTALLDDLSARGAVLRTGTRVTAVDRTAVPMPASSQTPQRPGAASPVWRVRLTGPDGDCSLTTDRLVLATPAAATLALLAPVLPGVSGVRTDPGADVVLATLVLDAPALDAAPRGTGVLVAAAARGTGRRQVRAKALTHATAKWPWLAERAGPGRHVLRLSYGQAGVDGGSGTAADLDTDALAGVALRDAAALLGVPLAADQLVGSARVRWSQSLPQPSAAHRTAVAAVLEQVGPVDGLEVVGSWVAGTGLAAVVAQARAAGRRVAGPG